MAEQERRTTEGLVRDAARADPEALAEVFLRYRPRIEMWISLRMGPLLRARLTVDDILQETFLEAHRSLGSFVDQGPGSFNRWMLSVAENRLRDLHRYHTAQKRHPGREAQPRPSPEEDASLLERLVAAGSSPSSGAHRRESITRMVRCIESLAEEERDVLIQRTLEERTLKEIAGRRGEGLGKVQALYARALANLKQRLAAPVEG